MERAKKWERRSEERPAELVAAAQRLFVERGFAGTRLDDVAAAAGVSKATVYLYFESKEQLFEAVIRESVTPSFEQAAALVEVFDGTTPNLVRMLLRLFESALDGPFPAIAKLIISEAGNFPALTRLWTDLVLRRGFAFLTRVIERGIERGEFRPVEPDEVVPLVMGPILLLGLWKHSLGKHSDFQLDRSAILAAHVEMILRGLAADRSQPAPKGKR